MHISYILSYQLKLIKMRAKLDNLNHCAVLFFQAALPSTCAGTTRQYTICTVVRHKYSAVEHSLFLSH